MQGLNKMNMKKFLILGIALLVTLVSCKKDVIWVPDGYGADQFVKPTTPYQPDLSFKTVVYLPSYRTVAAIDTTALESLTHVIYAFMQPKSDGSLVLQGTKENMQAAVRLVKRHNKKIVIAMNGVDSVFTTIVSNPQLRSKFIANIVSFTLQNQFDGVDMDWEYPRSNKANDVTFGIFMQELGAELHSWHRTLSMAVTAGIFAGTVKEGISKEAIDACDFVNLMAYDGIGTDAANPNHHASYGMAERVLNIWITEKGLPANKAVLGLPAYGKTAANAATPYRDLLAMGANANADEFTKDGKTYYYNGENTIRLKTQLAKQKGNGIMFWEWGQDAAGAQSLIKVGFAAAK